MPAALQLGPATFYETEKSRLSVFQFFSDELEFILADGMDVSLVVGLLAAVPLSIIANMLTPRTQRWWAKTSAARKTRRIQKLKAELAELTAEEAQEFPATAPPRPTENAYEFPIPKLECEFASSDINLPSCPHSSVIALALRNSELRYDSSVHKLRADMVFKPFRGDPLAKRAGIFSVKMKDDDGKDKWCFTPLTSIGMGGVAHLLVIVKQEDGRFYSLKYEDHNAVIDQQLPLGEWTVDLTLTADNALKEGSFKLGLRPDGAMSLHPFVDRTEPILKSPKQLHPLE